ncbi:MAG: aminotransferase class III-fold pyridoxal phosphate-dependent enzyme [Chloroflexota bacterium]|nr:aminotransferase class III-fold pyridoxal phosphate-dependent enzyme [Chloroflexota bacterium]
MMESEWEGLISKLREEYEQAYAQSGAAHARASEVLVDGISHGARTFVPYPFRIKAAEGAHVQDVDGHQICDFWQGHYANILGHNPPLVRRRLVDALDGGFGLQTGLLEERQVAFGSLLCNAVGGERIRFTTSGTLATMYAIMMARAYTGRDLIVKVGGGWHGASPFTLKGVHPVEGDFHRVDSAGVPEATDKEIIVARFNDVENLCEIFETFGDRIACFILEPCPSGIGFIPATGDFMNTARELTWEYGALLILDEVITGFRFCAGGMQRLYGIKADLSTFGKVVGGGMPLSAVVGRGDVMDLISEKAKERVWFNGGTFSAHPLALLAGQTMVEYLTEHEGEIYPALAAKGEKLRRGIEKVFADRGVLAQCTGHGNGVVPGSSVGGVYFPLEEDHPPFSGDEFMDSHHCSVRLREEGLRLGLLLHQVNVVHGLGAVSYRHSEEDLERTLEAYDAFALRMARERS